MNLNQNIKKAENIYSELSLQDQRMTSVSEIAYGLQKICPDIFFANLAREYEAKRVDGMAAQIACYRRLAKRLSSDI